MLQCVLGVTLGHQCSGCLCNCSCTTNAELNGTEIMNGCNDTSF